MRWIALAAVCFVSFLTNPCSPDLAHSKGLIDTLRTSSNGDRSAETSTRNYRRSRFPSWKERNIDRQLRKISKLIEDYGKKSGCSGGLNVAGHCKIHWLHDTLLNLFARINSKKSKVRLETERERKIHQKHLIINNLIDNMMSVTDCGPEKDDEEKKKEEREKEAAQKSAEKKLLGKGSSGGKKQEKKPSDGSQKAATGGQAKDDGGEAAAGSGEGEAGKEGSGEGSGEGEAGKEGSGEGTPLAEVDPEGESGPATGCDYSKFTPSHTMLLPSKEGCKVHKTGLTEEDKKTVLRLHNELRAKVARGEELLGNPGPQPPAADMRELVWNDQLAEVAEAWAKQCVQGHDKPGARLICSNQYNVGQNLHFYFGPSPEVDWEKAVNSWYKEVSDLTDDIVGKFRPLTPIKIGHYTQVVWADTWEIGCGIAHYEYEREGNVYPESKTYACNYGEAGNVLTLPMYTEGPAASLCPDEVSSNYPDLCQ